MVCFDLCYLNFSILVGIRNTTPIWCGPGLKEERKVIDLEETEYTEDIEEDEEQGLVDYATYQYIVPSPFGDYRVTTTYELLQ
jgi:hypothetical protein